MKPTTIEGIEKEFDKLYEFFIGKDKEIISSDCPTISFNKAVKSFYRQKITEIIEGIPEPKYTIDKNGEKLYALMNYPSEVQSYKQRFKSNKSKLVTLGKNVDGWPVAKVESNNTLLGKE